jgi:hypothetical protein
MKTEIKKSNNEGNVIKNEIKVEEKKKGVYKNFFSGVTIINKFIYLIK